VEAGSATQSRQSAVPNALVGTWGRTLTGAAWKKNHVNGEPAGVYSVAISSDGTATLEFGATPFTHMPAAASGTVLKLGATADGVCAGPASYAWRVAGRTLTLHLKKDDCDPRRVLFSGPLKRK
jgi:hypothetical protein